MRQHVFFVNARHGIRWLSVLRTKYRVRRTGAEVLGATYVLDLIFSF